MNLTWHLIKKDLRALRWPLALWVAVLAGKILLGVALLAAGGGSGDSGELDQRFRSYEVMVGLLTALEYAGILLVARLVHEDGLVGSTAFWPTRPVSGLRLLGVKLAGLLLIFGLIPVAVALPWWVGCHLSPAEIAWAAGETAARHLLVALVGLTLAALTDGLGRFVLWLVALFALVPLTTFNMIAYFSRRDAVVPADLATTRFALGLLVAVSGMGWIIAWQFCTRRTARSVGLAVATYLAVVAVGLWWPWSSGLGERLRAWQLEHVQSRWAERAEPPGLTFSITGASLRRPAGSRPERPSQLAVDYAVSGLPDHQVLIPATGSYTLRWPDAKEERDWCWARYEKTDWVARRILGLPAGKTDTPGTGRFTQILKHTTVERLGREPADYTLQARFTLLEAVGKAEIAVDEGQRLFAGSFGERLGWFERGDRETLLTMVRSRPLSTTDLVIELNSFLAGTAPLAWPAKYLLWDEQANDVDVGSPRKFRDTRVAGVEIRWDSFGYQLGMPVRSPGAVTPARPTRLVRIQYRVLGGFSHELHARPLVAKADEN